MSLMYIALGGGLGAVSRFLLTERINNISDLFPFGTLSVNILGCFVVGCIAGYFASKSSPMYLFFVIGFLGSFTTMSAFSIQTIELFNSNSISGIIYVIFTFSFTIVATYIGLTVFSK
tara:strand:- start:629 stop:982 length:354 start_codon:yes stop_codon:yes gene_type:complete